MENNMQHPLLNPESKHYQMVDGIESVERLEQMYSTEELATWAKITAMKYRMRIGNKEDTLKDAAKIKDYEAYYTHLTDERSETFEERVDKYVEELWNDRETTSEEGDEEAPQETQEAPTSNPERGTEEREDNQFSELIEALQKRIGGDAKVSIIGHTDSGIGLAIEGCNPDELPPSEELGAIVEAFRPRSN